jgi:hypothetical protein
LAISLSYITLPRNDIRGFVFPAGGGCSHLGVEAVARRLQLAVAAARLLLAPLQLLAHPAPRVSAFAAVPICRFAATGF